ncbi:LigA (plasmid) [Rhizorhabdus wittichii RW1]|uniref:LigA n=1 Tax=Rhizorhabdus wittichii (strain DSM 6014 / CCUG 31198 / JCM 15750 / NBRC 105917 / EY 4224 / RW1) TaxID=392499 RepID=A0A9J9LGL1_RHIWR|nr:LigA [Rhizorhabdus wittichii RW1]
MAAWGRDLHRRAQRGRGTPERRWRGPPRSGNTGAWNGVAGPGPLAAGVTSTARKGRWQPWPAVNGQSSGRPPGSAPRQWPRHPARRRGSCAGRPAPTRAQGERPMARRRGHLGYDAAPGARQPCARRAARARRCYRFGPEQRISARAPSGLDEGLRPGAEHSPVGGVLDAHLVERDGEEAHRPLVRPGGLGAAQAAAIRKAGNPADEPDTEPLRPGRCVRRQPLDQIIGPPGPRCIGPSRLAAPLGKGERLLRRQRRRNFAYSRHGRNRRTGLGARPGPLDPEALEPGLPGRFPRFGFGPLIALVARPAPGRIRGKPPVGQRPAGGRDMNAQGLLRGVIAPAHGRGAVGSGRPGAAEGQDELEPLALQAGRQRLPRRGRIGRLGGKRDEVRAAEDMRRFRLSRRRRRRGLERGRRRAVRPRRRAAPQQESPARQRERGHEAAGNGKTAGPEIGLAHVRVIPNCKAGSTPPVLFLLTGR